MPRQGEQITGALPCVWTIGHSNQSLEQFLSLLKTHSVDVAADVRSQPYSKYAPQFDHDAMKRALSDSGLRYVYLGRELGGRPEGKDFYDPEGHVLYDRVAATSIFQEGISRLERGIREFRVAVVCAEEDPVACHRRLLVGRVLIDHGFRVEHIRGDGRIQTEEDVAAKRESDKEQLSFFQQAETESWKSIFSVPRKKRPRHETPSELASS